MFSRVVLLRAHHILPTLNRFAGCRRKSKGRQPSGGNLPETFRLLPKLPIFTTNIPYLVIIWSFCIHSGFVVPSPLFVLPKIALPLAGRFLYPSLYFSRLVFTLGNFQQHITCSTATGIAIGGIAYCFGFDHTTCLVAAGLCSFAGMLPDIDSDTSKSFQECIYLAAGIGCILTVSRLRHHDVDADFAMFGGAMMLLFIRFGVGSWIKKITVHRGMIHSIPMAILVGQLTFFAVTGTIEERLLKAAALTIGFLSHLILDEMYSIDSTGAKLRLKRSFGTALKWSNPKRPGSVAIIYTSVFCLGLAGISHPDVIERRNGAVEVAEQSSQNEPLLAWSQSQQRDVLREAAEFLAQTSGSAVSPPYTQAPFTPVIARPVELAPLSVLPPVMQIENDWNRGTPIQPARIVLP